MGCDVYANGDEISCKAADNTVIAAFPDVCLSPPSPPAGPVPVPYANTSMSKDMQNGSKTVMIKDKEVMLKDQSFYKTSPLGDEAATNGLGAGVTTHVITGKTYFVAWSMDVKFEGQNVDRHSDLTTSNHASPMANEQLPKDDKGEEATPPPDDTKCPCCNQRRHANQKNADGSTAQIVTEEQWYGPDGYKKVQEARANGCTNVPATPDDGKCGAYYLQRSSNQAKKSRKSFNDNGGKLEYAVKYNTVHFAEIAAGTNTPIMVIDGVQGETICHKVPNAAGGCSSGKELDRNLERKGDLTGPCQDLDNELEKFHTARAVHWQNPANVP